MPANPGLYSGYGLKRFLDALCFQIKCRLILSIYYESDRYLGAVDADSRYLIALFLVRPGQYDLECDRGNSSLAFRSALHNALLDTCKDVFVVLVQTIVLKADEPSVRIVGRIGICFEYFCYSIESVAGLYW